MDKKMKNQTVRKTLTRGAEFRLKCDGGNGHFARCKLSMMGDEAGSVHVSLTRAGECTHHPQSDTCNLYQVSCGREVRALDRFSHPDSNSSVRCVTHGSGSMYRTRHGFDHCPYI